MPRYQRVGGPVRSPHRLAATCQPTANGSRSGGVALLRQSRSALRRSSLGHGHGQAIGARMHGSAPWKTEETIVGLPRLLVLSVFSRFGGCHLSPPLSPFTSQPHTEAEVAALRCCVNRGRPFGDPKWVTDTAKRLGLESTIRPRGRPKKQS